MSHGKMGPEITPASCPSPFTPPEGLDITRAHQWNSQWHTNILYYSFNSTCQWQTNSPAMRGRNFICHYICWCLIICEDILHFRQSSGRAASFLPAELWPGPTTAIGFFLLSLTSLNMGLYWGIFILPASSSTWHSTLVQSHNENSKSLPDLSHVISDCRVVLLCTQVKPEALLQMCTSCTPVSNGS